MDNLILQIWAALVLDLVIGDPQWWPHPIRFIGRLSELLERPARLIFGHGRRAGFAVTAIVVGGTGGTAWLLLKLADNAAPSVYFFASVYILYTSFASKDLAVHAMSVLKALEADDLCLSRSRISLMVGRDTDGLGREGIVRAAVESVAENSVDGVIAPLFYAFLFGPVGAISYKAVSTLDSTFGYRNKRYLHFGWAPARLDDLANYIPARISPILVSAGALLLGGRAWPALRIALRDGRKEDGPNSGYPEAAFSGALGVRLGGPVVREGRPADGAWLGDDSLLPAPIHIRRAYFLMLAVTFLTALALTGVRLAF